MNYLAAQRDTAEQMGQNQYFHWLGKPWPQPLPMVTAASNRSHLQQQVHPPVPAVVPASGQACLPLPPTAYWPTELEPALADVDPRGQGHYLVGWDHRLMPVPSYVWLSHYQQPQELEFPPRAKPVLLLLPFTGAHSGQMRDFAWELGQRGYPSVLLDLPGHGRSGGPRGTFSVAGVSQTLQSALTFTAKTYPNRPIVLFGSSWGGDLALLYGFWQQHELQLGHTVPTVQAIVAQAAITPWQRDVFAYFRPGLTTFLGMEGAPTELMRLAIRTWIGPRLPLTRMFRLDQLYLEPALAAQFQADPLSLTCYCTDCYLEYLLHHPVGVAQPLAMPTLVLQGDRDRLVAPVYAQRAYQRLAPTHPQSQFQLLPDVGHCPVQEHPALLADSVTDWLHQQSFLLDLRAESLSVKGPSPVRLTEQAVPL